MTEQNKPVVWLIDENLIELRTYRALLEKEMPATVQVNQVQALPLLDDYLEMLSDPHSVCFVIDEKLKDTGVANYKGIELATYLRALNTKLPMYILTNYADEADEFMGAEWSVEDIIAKKDLASPDRRRIVVARIVRRIDVYEDLLGERDERFRALLKKTLDDKLDESEKAELEELQLQRTSGILAYELDALKHVEEAVRAHDKLMSKLKSSSEDVEDAD